MKQEQLIGIFLTVSFLFLVFKLNDFFYRKFINRKKSDVKNIFYPRYKWVFIVFFSFTSLLVLVMLLARIDDGLELRRDYILFLALLTSLSFLILQIFLRPVFYLFDNKIIIDYGFKRVEILDTFFEPQRFIFILKEIRIAERSLYVAGEYSYLTTLF